MQKRTRHPIVFTDLDGTLLNHRDYAFDDAMPALARIRSMHIPLIICTSKTRREVEYLRKGLQIDDPFIVENGGGIFFPRDYRGFTIPEAIGFSEYKSIMLGVPYAKIRYFIEVIRPFIPLSGFGDWNIADIIARTGLSLEAATMAKERDFTEPFQMHDPVQLEELTRAARMEGLSITRGGRFLHFIGENSDKGTAVEIVKSIFAANWKAQVLAIGLGDTTNDIAMLKQVDIPVLIPRDDGSYEDITLPGLIRAPSPGSRGWNTVMLALLDSLDSKDSKQVKSAH